METVEPVFWKRVVAEVRGVAVEEVTPAQRLEAKTACFTWTGARCLPRSDCATDRAFR
jgi:hypothetical protein